MIHISELSEKRIEHPKEVLHEGDVVTLRVIKIDPDNHRIGLSLRRVESMAYADLDWQSILESEMQEEEKAPSTEVIVPLAEEIAPLAEEKAPVAAEKAPMAAEKAPVAAEKAPVVAEKAPVVTEKAPKAEKKAAPAKEKAPPAEEKPAE